MDILEGNSERSISLICFPREPFIHRPFCRARRYGTGLEKWKEGWLCLHDLNTVLTGGCNRKIPQGSGSCHSDADTILLEKIHPGPTLCLVNMALSHLSQTLLSKQQSRRGLESWPLLFSGGGEPESRSRSSRSWPRISASTTPIFWHFYDIDGLAYHSIKEESLCIFTCYLGFSQ